MKINEMLDKVYTQCSNEAPITVLQYRDTFCNVFEWYDATVDEMLDVIMPTVSSALIRFPQIINEMDNDVDKYEFDEIFQWVLANAVPEDIKNQFDIEIHDRFEDLKAQLQAENKII